MNWRQVHLGDGINVKHGFAFKGEYFSPTGEYLVLTPGNFLEKGGFRVRAGKERYYHADFPEEYLLSEGDLVVAMTEQGEGLLGSAARIPSDIKCLHNQRLGLVQITDPSLFDRSFLYWVFNSQAVRDQIRATATGAKVKHTAPERIKKVRVSVPHLADQRAIAHVLDSYDDLIATNQRRIALLEEAARLLYREWFVQLRFPGHESLTLQDGLPEGWSRATLGELCDEVPGASVQTGPFGSQLHQHDYKAEGVPVVMPQDIVGDRIRHDRIAFVDEATAARLDRHALQPLDIVFPRRGDIAKRALVEAHQAGYLCGTGCLKISLPLAPLHPVVLYFQLADPTMVKWIEGQAVGATMLNLSATILKSVSCLVPSADAQARFVEIVSDIRRQIDFIERSITETARARDLLLPKLMSGQLDVSRIPLPEEVAA